MIAIGEFFDYSQLRPTLIEVRLDADRRVQIARDNVRGNFCVRFYNGTVKKDVALMPDMMVALFQALGAALDNPETFDEPATDE